MTPSCATLQMYKLTRFLKLARTPNLLRRLLSLGNYGYLVDTGWTKSVLLGRPVSASGLPIPWMTLSFIDFIEARLRPDMCLFEFGTGASTHFYASRVKQIDSVEHDARWHAEIQAQLPSRARVILVPLDRGGEYALSCLHWSVFYDMVIIDGRDRVNCIKSALGALAPDGCLVLDDSERPDYLEGCDALTQAGFKRLDFWGMAPALTYRKCTSVFYRPMNCLYI
jgi:hypothetical protein